MSVALETQVATLIGQVQVLAGETARMADAVTKLAVMETNQKNDRDALTRAFDAIKDHEARVRKLEDAQPLQKQTSDWVMKGVGLLLAAFAGVLISLAVTKPDLTAAVDIRRQPPAQSIGPR